MLLFFIFYLTSNDFDLKKLFILSTYSINVVSTYTYREPIAMLVKCESRNDDAVPEGSVFSWQAIYKFRAYRLMNDTALWMISIQIDELTEN